MCLLIPYEVYNFSLSLFFFPSLCPPSLVPVELVDCTLVFSIIPSSSLPLDHALVTPAVCDDEKLFFYSLKGIWASGCGPQCRAPLAFAARWTWSSEVSRLFRPLLASPVSHSLGRAAVPKGGELTFWGRDSHSHVMWARVGRSPYHGGLRLYIVGFM